MDFKSAMQAFAEAWTAANGIKVNKNPSENEAEKVKENEEIDLQTDEKVSFWQWVQLFLKCNQDINEACNYLEVNLSANPKYKACNLEFCVESVDKSLFFGFRMGAHILDGQSRPSAQDMMRSQKYKQSETLYYLQ